MDLKLFFFACTLNLFYYVPNLLASPVIGGIADTDNLFQYHVSIQINPDPGRVHTTSHYCGGAIISDRYILSAAHSFIDKMNGKVKFFYQPGIFKIKVLAGTSKTHDRGIISRVSKIFIPHAYDVISNDQGQQVDADIAVLKLWINLNLAVNNHRLRFISLDEGREVYHYENQNAFTMGNGCDSLRETDDGVLVDDPKRLTAARRNILQVKMLDRHHCRVFDSAICAVSAWSNVRSCASGDAGSPLVYDNHVIGVFSQGPISYYTAEAPLMIFTRVSVHIDFIMKAIMDPSAPHNEMYILDQ